MNPTMNDTWDNTTTNDTLDNATTTTEPTAPQNDGSTQDTEDQDVLFLVAIVCCSVGGLLILISIVRLVYFFIQDSKDRKLFKEQERQRQNQRYLNNYAKEGNGFNQYLIVGSASEPGTGSWPNLAFDWTEAAENNPYITDGAVGDTSTRRSNRLNHNGSTERL